MHLPKLLVRTLLIRKMIDQGKYGSGEKLIRQILIMKMTDREKLLIRGIADQGR